MVSNMNIKIDSDIVHCELHCDIGLPWFWLRIDILHTRFYFCILVCKIAVKLSNSLEIFYKCSSLQDKQLVKNIYETRISIPKVMG